MMNVVALSSCQLSSDTYVNDLWNKLFEANANRSALARRLVEAENKLKGTEVTLEEVQYQIKGEKAKATVL